MLLCGYYSGQYCTWPGRLCPHGIYAVQKWFRRVRLSATVGDDAPQAQLEGVLGYRMYEMKHKFILFHWGPQLGQHGSYDLLSADVIYHG